MQDENISSAEIRKIVLEMEKYCKLKQEIQRQNKAKVKQIMKEQQEKLFEKGRKKGNENLQKITVTSGIQNTNTI